jgi:hypothetical protein
MHAHLVIVTKRRIGPIQIVLLLSIPLKPIAMLLTLYLLLLIGIIGLMRDPGGVRLDGGQYQRHGDTINLAGKLDGSARSK